MCDVRIHDVTRRMDMRERLKELSKRRSALLEGGGTKEI
jgi:hypothetical protein